MSNERYQKHRSFINSLQSAYRLATCSCLLALSVGWYVEPATRASSAQLPLLPFRHNPIPSDAVTYHSLSLRTARHVGHYAFAVVMPAPIHLWTSQRQQHLHDILGSLRLAAAELKLPHARPDDDELLSASIAESERTTASYATEHFTCSVSGPY